MVLCQILREKSQKHFLNLQKKITWVFLALEYSGHGKSYGKFTNGNISKWSRETSQLIRKEVKNNEIILVGSSMGSWISLNQFINDVKKNKVLNMKIHQNLRVTMVHGSNDKSVPIIYSKKVLKIFANAKKKLVIIKKGDHSLSEPKWLKILIKELKLIIN